MHFTDIIYNVISKISKIRQKYKNNQIVKESTSQVSDIIFDACMKHENYLIKIFDEDLFYNYYILYQHFKIAPKIQK